MSLTRSQSQLCTATPVYCNKCSIYLKKILFDIFMLRHRKFIYIYINIYIYIYDSRLDVGGSLAHPADPKSYSSWSSDSWQVQPNQTGLRVGVRLNENQQHRGVNLNDNKSQRRQQCFVWWKSI